MALGDCATEVEVKTPASRGDGAGNLSVHRLNVFWPETGCSSTRNCPLCSARRVQMSGMRGSATVSMSAPAAAIWDLVSDVTNTGRFSLETFDAEWLDGAIGPALGARFRGHVKRNEIGPVYWTTCRVTACERGHEFGFEVLVGSVAVNNWHYRYAARMAVHDVDILIAAAGAAHRAASWLPDAAVSFGDYELLGDAADIMARQRTRRRW